MNECASECECEFSVRVLADDLSCVNSPADRAISLADNLSGISRTAGNTAHLPSDMPLPYPPSTLYRVFKLKENCANKATNNFQQSEMRKSQKASITTGSFSSLPRPLAYLLLLPPPTLPGRSDNKVNSAYSSSAMAIVFALLHCNITTVPPTSMRIPPPPPPLPLTVVKVK